MHIIIKNVWAFGFISIWLETWRGNSKYQYETNKDILIDYIRKK